MSYEIFLRRGDKGFDFLENVATRKQDARATAAKAAIFADEKVTYDEFSVLLDVNGDGLTNKKDVRIYPALFSPHMGSLLKRASKYDYHLQEVRLGDRALDSFDPSCISFRLEAAVALRPALYGELSEDVRKNSTLTLIAVRADTTQSQKIPDSVSANVISYLRRCEPSIQLSATLTQKADAWDSHIVESTAKEKAPEKNITATPNNELDIDDKRDGLGISSAETAPIGYVDFEPVDVFAARALPMARAGQRRIDEKEMAKMDIFKEIVWNQEKMKPLLDALDSGFAEGHGGLLTSGEYRPTLVISAHRFDGEITTQATLSLEQKGRDGNYYPVPDEITSLLVSRMYSNLENLQPIESELSRMNYVLDDNPYTLSGYSYRLELPKMTLKTVQA